MGALALLTSAFGGVALAESAPAAAAPGTLVYAEDFENTPNTDPVLLSDYVGVSGQEYTADPAWLTACNGQIRSFNTPYTTLGNCATVGYTSQLGQLAYAIGVHAGDADPAANNVVAAYTDNNPGVNSVEFQTVTNIPLASSSGRYLTFSVDTAAVNCQVSAPLYQFAFLDEEESATNVGSILNACSSGQTVAAPPYGDLSTQNVSVGTYTSDGSILFDGASLGIQMRNANGSGAGNDAAFDNIRILDVTPQLDKAFSPAVVPTGGTSTLTFTVANTDELAAKNGWSFTDALPDGLTLADPTAAASTCTNSTVTAAVGGTSVAVTGDLAAGQASCTVTVNVTSDEPGSFTNGPDNVTTTGLDEPGTSTVTFESPELSLTKNAGDAVDVNENGITDAGDTIQYTFEVENSGDVTIDGLAINDPKIAAVTCPVTTLAPGESTTCAADAVYVITVEDASAGSADNTANATGTSPTGAEITSNDSSTETPVEVQTPGISIVKSADPSDSASYTVGQEITYYFAVTNTGNVPLADVSVNEGEFTGTGELSPVVCPATAIPTGEQIICDATYTLTAADVDAGSVSNSATATGTPPGGGTIDSPPSEVLIPIEPAPGITIEKSASPEVISAAGQTVTYSFLVTNTGNVTLDDVVINDTEFSGTGELGAIDCPTATLVAGQFITCTAEYTVTQGDVNTADELTNTATATGTPPTGDSVTSDPSTSTVDITRVPSLSIVKSSDIEEVEVGQTITYSVLITNTGNVTVTNPEVLETEFSGSGDLAPIEYPAEDVVLQPGESVTYTTTYTVTQEDINSGELTNTATATGDVPPGNELPPTPPSTVIVDTDPLPSLAIEKTADVTTITTVGQKVTYSFVVTNTGNVTISDPTVNEGKFSGNGELSAVTCPTNATALAPGDSVTCTATYTVVAADLMAGAGELTNTATATGNLPGGGTLTSDPSTVSIVSEPDTPVEPGVSGPGGLASTGALIAPTAGIALLLIAVGGAFLVLRRRMQDV